jgi:glyoxalase family protein
MATDILGIHHVTALCGAPVPNLRFYGEVLGLRLVKKTVNFDNPHAYHFYFGDRTGRPGTLMTFFPHPNWRAGVPGSREVARTDFGVPAGALGYWAERLTKAGVELTRGTTLGGQERLEFSDPDGTRLSVIDNELREVSAEAPTSEVPPERAVTGIASVAIVVSSVGETAQFLTEMFGFKNLGSDGRRTWFEAGAHAPSQQLEVIEDPGAAPAVLGAGSVHHVAWRVADAAAQARVRSLVDGKVLGLTDVRDRNYFQSIYFREPGGVIFEVATDVPGFLVDEDEASLGATLKLPAEFEPQRAEIEAALPSLAE